MVKLAKIEVFLAFFLIIAAIYAGKKNKILEEQERLRLEEEYNNKMSISRTNWHGDLDYGTDLLKRRQTIVPNFKNYKNIKYFKSIRPLYKDLDFLGQG